MFPTQSPVDLSNAIEVSKLPPLKLSNFEIEPKALSLYNDGTGLTLTASYTDNLPVIENGPLNPNAKYYLHHIKEWIEFTHASMRHSNPTRW